jgi:hypothetical protein
MTFIGRITSGFGEKKFYCFLFVGLAALVLLLAYVLPPGTKIYNRLVLFKTVFNDAAPTVILRTGGVDVIGDVPFQMNFENRVIIRIDTTADTTFLSSAGPFSILISQDGLFIKTKEKVERIDLKNVQTDEDVVLAPGKVRHFIDTKLTKLAVSLGVVIVFVLYLAILMLAFLGAGITLLIDTFRNGPFQFVHLANWSVLLLFLLSVLSIPLVAAAISLTLVFIILFAAYSIAMLSIIARTSQNRYGTRI